MTDEQIQQDCFNKFIFAVYHGAKGSYEYSKEIVNDIERNNGTEQSNIVRKEIWDFIKSGKMLIEWNDAANLPEKNGIYYLFGDSNVFYASFHDGVWYRGGVTKDDAKYNFANGIKSDMS